MSTPPPVFLLAAQPLLLLPPPAGSVQPTRQIAACCAPFSYATPRSSLRRFPVVTCYSAYPARPFLRTPRLFRSPGFVLYSPGRLSCRAIIFPLIPSSSSPILTRTPLLFLLTLPPPAVAEASSSSCALLRYCGPLRLSILPPSSSGATPPACFFPGLFYSPPLPFNFTPIRFHYLPPTFFQASPPSCCPSLPAACRRPFECSCSLPSPFPACSPRPFSLPIDLLTCV